MNARTVARPYAEAIFELALKDNNLLAWSSFLKMAACIARDPSVQHLLADPRLSNELVVKLFYAVARTVWFDRAGRCVEQLAKKKRLQLLPIIAELFNQSFLQHQNMTVATVFSAQPLPLKARTSLIQALQHRLGRSVQLVEQIDPKLLCGAIIQIGDRRFDGSGQDGFRRLMQALVTHKEQ